MDAKECRIARLEIDSAELGQRLGDEVESHLAGCPSCAQFRLERSQLRELVGSLKPVAAPADFEIRLRARIAREKDSRSRQPFIFRFAMTTPGMALAAGLVLLIAAAIWINQNRTPKTEPAVAATPLDEAPKTAAPNNQSNENTGPTVPQVAYQPPVAPKKTIPNVKNAKGLPMNSADFSVGSARSVGIRSDREGEVSLTAPSQPMVVTVEDANGAKHKILLPPVSFGAQRFDNRTPVSMSNRKDW